MTTLRSTEHSLITESGAGLTNWQSRPVSDDLRSIKEEAPTFDANECLLSISSILGQCNFGDLNRNDSPAGKSALVTEKSRRLQRQKIEDVVATLKTRKLAGENCFAGGTSSVGSQNIAVSDIPSAIPPTLRSLPVSVPDGQLSNDKKLDNSCPDGTSSVGCQNTILSESTVAAPPVQGPPPPSNPDGEFSNLGHAFNPQIISVCSLTDTVEAQTCGKPSKRQELPCEKSVCVDQSQTVSRPTPEDLRVGIVQSVPTVPSGVGLDCDSVNGTLFGSPVLHSALGTVSQSPVQAGTSCEKPPTDSTTIDHAPHQIKDYQLVQTSASNSFKVHGSDEQSQSTTTNLPGAQMQEVPRSGNVSQLTDNLRKVQNQGKLKCLFPLCNRSFPSKVSLRKHLRSFRSHSMKLVPVSASCDLSSAEACDIFLSKDLTAYERKHRLKEFVRHLSDEDIVETVLPGMVKQGTFDDLSDPESSNLAYISKCAALWDFVDSQTTHPLRSGCKGMDVATLIESFECFRGQVVKKLTKMVSVVEEPQPSVSSGDQSSLSDAAEQSGELAGGDAQVQQSSSEASATNVMQNHCITDHANSDGLGTLGEKTASCVQSEESTTPALASVQSHEEGHQDPEKVLSENDSDHDDLPPHSLPLPFRLVDGKFRRKCLSTSKKIAQKGFVEFIETCPFDASKRVLSGMAAGKSFFREFVMPTFYKQNYNGCVELACKLASTLSLPSEKVNMSWQDIGVELERVLGVNILPRQVVFGAGQKQMNAEKDRASAEEQRATRRLRQKTNGPNKQPGSRPGGNDSTQKGRQRYCQRKQMQDILTENSMAESNKQPEARASLLMTGSSVSLTGKGCSSGANLEQMEVVTFAEGSLTEFEHPPKSRGVPRTPTSPLPCLNTVSSMRSPLSTSSAARAIQDFRLTPTVTRATCASGEPKPKPLTGGSVVSVGLVGSAFEASRAAYQTSALASAHKTGSAVLHGASNPNVTKNLRNTNATPSNTALPIGMTSNANVTNGSRGVASSGIWRSASTIVTADSTATSSCLSRTRVTSGSAPVRTNVTAINPATNSSLRFISTNVTPGRALTHVPTSVTPGSSLKFISTNVTPGRALTHVRTSVTPGSSLKFISTNVTPGRALTYVPTSVPPGSFLKFISTNVTPGRALTYVPKSVTPGSSLKFISTNVTPGRALMSVPTSLPPGSSLKFISTNVTSGRAPTSVPTSVTPGSSLKFISTNVTPGRALTAVATSVTPGCSSKFISTNVTPGRALLSVPTSVSPGSSLKVISTNVTPGRALTSVPTIVTSGCSSKFISTNVTPGRALTAVAMSVTAGGSSKFISTNVTPGRAPTSVATSVTPGSSLKVISTNVTPGRPLTCVATSMAPGCLPGSITKSVTAVNTATSICSSRTLASMTASSSPKSVFTSVTPGSALTFATTTLTSGSSTRPVTTNVTLGTISTVTSICSSNVLASVTPENALKSLSTSVTPGRAPTSVTASLTPGSSPRPVSTSVTSLNTETTICSNYTLAGVTPRSSCKSVFTSLTPALKSVTTDVTPGSSPRSVTTSVTTASTSKSVSTIVTPGHIKSVTTPGSSPTKKSTSLNVSPSESVSPGMTLRSKPSVATNPACTGQTSNKTTELNSPCLTVTCGHSTKPASARAPGKRSKRLICDKANQVFSTTNRAITHRKPVGAGVTRKSACICVQSARTARGKSTRASSKSLTLAIGVGCASSTSDKRKNMTLPKSTRESVTRHCTQSASTGVTHNSITDPVPSGERKVPDGEDVYRDSRPSSSDSLDNDKASESTKPLVELPLLSEVCATDGETSAQSTVGTPAGGPKTSDNTTLHQSLCLMSVDKFSLPLRKSLGLQTDSVGDEAGKSAGAALLVDNNESNKNVLVLVTKVADSNTAAIQVVTFASGNTTTTKPHAVVLVDAKNIPGPTVSNASIVNKPAVSAVSQTYSAAAMTTTAACPAALGAAAVALVSSACPSASSTNTPGVTTHTRGSVRVRPNFSTVVAALPAGVPVKVVGKSAEEMGLKPAAVSVNPVPKKIIQRTLLVPSSGVKRRRGRGRVARKAARLDNSALVACVFIDSPEESLRALFTESNRPALPASCLPASRSEVGPVASKIAQRPVNQPLTASTFRADSQRSPFIVPCQASVKSEVTPVAGKVAEPPVNQPLTASTSRAGSQSSPLIVPCQASVKSKVSPVVGKRAEPPVSQLLTASRSRADPHSSALGKSKVAAIGNMTAKAPLKGQNIPEPPVHIFNSVSEDGLPGTYSTTGKVVNNTGEEASSSLPPVGSDATRVLPRGDAVTETEPRRIENIQLRVTLIPCFTDKRTMCSLGSAGGCRPQTSLRQSCEGSYGPAALDTAHVAAQEATHPVESLGQATLLGPAVSAGCTAPPRAQERSDVVTDSKQSFPVSVTGPTPCHIKVERTPKSPKTSRKRHNEVTVTPGSKARVFYVSDKMVPQTSYHVSPSCQGPGNAGNGKRKREN